MHAIALFAALLVFTSLGDYMVSAGGGPKTRHQFRLEPKPRADSDRKWWETAVIYQIYPRSFKDSNGDGTGDLPGITSKLEYLKDLGIGAVWLSPIYPSPQVDFGYDISDFIGIDPLYGTMDDFDNLLKTAHGLGLKLVLDFVPNHSSDQHEWFKKSVKRQDPYTDYYLWRNGTTDSETGERKPPNNWISSFRGPAWEWNDERKQYYYHQYAVQQPDLNYRNPKVVAEIKDAMKFWLNKGVDGFRVDAVLDLFEDENLRDEAWNPGTTDPMDHGYLIHNYTENLQETYDMVTEWRTLLDSYDGDRVMMTEAYGSMDQVVKYYGNSTHPGASFSFNFNLILSLGPASKAADFKNIIDEWMSKMDAFRKPNWVIGNHDQNRVASFSRYGPELADGILMVELLLPGTAMTYNGEEIGMENTYITWEQTKDPQAVNEGEANYLAKSRDLGRTPFQWDATTSAGFSDSKSTWLPVNPNYWRLNLKAQQEASRSHLKVYKALLQARKEPAVQSQNYEAIVVGDVLVIKRTLSGHDTFLAVVNLGTEEASLAVDQLGNLGTMQVWTSSLNSDLETGDSVKFSLNLRPKEGLVLTTGTAKKNSSPSSRAAAALTLLLALACWHLYS